MFILNYILSAVLPRPSAPESSQLDPLRPGVSRARHEAKTSRLESLPDELLLLILGRLSCSDDVLSLTQASRRCYKLRHDVLRSRIRDMLYVENRELALRAAAAFMTSRQIKANTYNLCEQRYRRDCLFAGIFDKLSRYDLMTTLETAVLSYLFDVLTMSHYFARLCVTWTLPDRCPGDTWWGSTFNTARSWRLEVNRIQHGFLLMELRAHSCFASRELQSSTLHRMGYSPAWAGSESPKIPHCTWQPFPICAYLKDVGTHIIDSAALEICGSRSAVGVVDFYLKARREMMLGGAALLLQMANVRRDGGLRVAAEWLWNGGELLEKRGVWNRCTGNIDVQVSHVPATGTIMEGIYRL